MKLQAACTKYSRVSVSGVPEALSTRLPSAAAHAYAVLGHAGPDVCETSGQRGVAVCGVVLRRVGVVDLVIPCHQVGAAGLRGCVNTRVASNKFMSMS